ncbi:hypothetical protein MLD38_040784 [Melastoma candidum]|nr:hypothetical protein MLD38_040784 [Melastoma candidum]
MKCKYVELTSDYVYPYRNQINQPKFAGSSCQGWTYALNGSLLKATRIKGIRNFDVENFGLKPLKVATWGPFVLLNLDDGISGDLQVNSVTAAHEWMGSCLGYFERGLP